MELSSSSVREGDMPSMDNMYHSTHWNKVRTQEFNASTNMWNSSIQDGVAPRPLYADMFNPIKPPQTLNIEPVKESTIPSLTGENVLAEKFTHNNMQPFYRGNIKQNIDPFATSAYLEHSTGLSKNYVKKREVDCFFEPTANVGNVCGMKDNTDFYKSHLNSPISRNNDFPIEQIRVGPGIGQGYTNLPQGGFQQASTLENIRPKTIDELRPLTRPKMTYELPTQGPQASKVQNRGLLGDIAKNRPDTYHEQSIDQWIRTTGAVIKQTEIPDFIVKPTTRPDGHVEYMGVGRADAQPGMGETDDYGRNGVVMYSNSRDETQSRTVLTNLTSIVKSIVAPFIDVLKHSQKEYTLDSARPYGNMSAQIPEKPTLYDPVDHILKTTVKETTIHDAREGGNMSAQIPEKPTLYDPMGPKTTIKETTIHDTTTLNPRGNNKGWVESDTPARSTVRQTTAVVDTVRNVNARRYKTVVINPESIAKKTMKETTLTNHIANVGGNNNTGAYTHIEVQVFDTQKQYMSDIQHTGISGGGGQYYPRTIDAEYNLEVDETREMMNIKAGYTPNAEGISQGIDSSSLDVEVKKLQSDSVNSREEGNITRIYQQGINAMNPCEITKDPQKACISVGNNRLDPSMLSPLKENPFNLSINPIG